MINIVSPNNQDFKEGFINVWTFIADKNPALVESMRNVKAGLAEKIPARKCSCVELEVKPARDFLIQNHLMGYASSAYKYGLMFNDELVMVITVCHSRYDRKAEYEIIRLASKQNTVIVGGASKLLNFIKQQLIPTSILSYSDNMLGDGNVYANLGFSFDGETQVGYFWYKDGETINRTSTQKHKLNKLFPHLSDDEIKNKTENQIMTEFGFIKIKNMGNKRWILGNSEQNSRFHKFHYVYKTTRPLIDDKFYIGIHSTNNMNDGYLGSGTIIQNSIRKYGKDLHKIEILEFSNSREELHDHEKRYVTIDQLLNPNCMNILLGGINRRETLRTNRGRIRIHHPNNPKTSFYVRTEDVEEFINLGYVRGFGVAVNQPKIFYKNNDGVVRRSNTPPDNSEILKPFWGFDATGMRNVQRGNENIRTLPEQILETDVIGWDVNSTEGKKLVSKDGIRKYIDPDELNSAFEAGWELGGFDSHLGKKQLSKDGIFKMVNVSEIDAMLQDGWELGRGFGNSSVANKKLMNKDGVLQYVELEQINFMFKDGWELGGHPGISTNKKTISKNGEVKFINPDEVDFYLEQGWVLGRGVGNSPTKDKKWMFKGCETRYINSSEVEEYRNKGWEDGKGLIQIKKDELIKEVFHDEAVDLIKNHGWVLRKARLDVAPIHVIRVAREVGMKIPKKFHTIK